ncbi:MAG TPA: histidine kinase N-terminal 7TM domain-containing protein, partial [Thermoanaerobaculia bacterium]|nr:histidine kinase N-terminal 7TM domain-containing protein [Thermoanaerobaculia bacterium]
MPPLTLTLLLGVCVTTAVAIYGWPRRAAPGAALLAPLLACATLWSGSAALELLARSAETKLLWSRASQLAVVPLPALWLLFCVDFSGSRASIRTGRAAALLASPALVAIALFAASRLDPAGSLGALEPAPLLGALAPLYGWFLIALGMAFLARRYARSSSLYRVQCGVLLLAGAIPLAVHALHVVGPLQGPDPTPASFGLASLVLGWGLFSYRLFDVTPIAYETVFNAMGDGVVVTDARGRVTTVNPIALAGLGKTLPEVLGKPLEALYD